MWMRRCRLWLRVRFRKVLRPHRRLRLWSRFRLGFGLLGSGGLLGLGMRCQWWLSSWLRFRLRLLGLHCMQLMPGLPQQELHHLFKLFVHPQLFTLLLAQSGLQRIDTVLQRRNFSAVFTAFCCAAFGFPGLATTVIGIRVSPVFLVVRPWRHGFQRR